ncbi:MAG: GntR family transcriptional regulator [Oligoflexales bacterium]|nr:GntR family transcriptional regulator [Oligoflexales bacterium]
MDIKFSLDELSNIPIYQQITEYFEKAILTGELKRGEYLPSIREFSMKNLVNPNTVAKAYQILQVRNLVEPMRGLGLKVMTVNRAFSERRKEEILNSSIDALIETGMSLQISKENLLKAVAGRVKLHGYQVVGEVHKKQGAT